MDTLLILFMLMVIPISIISAITYFILPFYIFKMNKKMDQLIIQQEELVRQLQFMANSRMGIYD